MGEAQILTRQQVLEASDLEEATVEIPAWGGAIKVRGFTKAQQQSIRKQAMVDGKMDEDRFEVLMFIQGVVEPEFGPDDFELLRGKSAMSMDLVLAKILELSGLTPKALKESERTFRQEP